MATKTTRECLRDGLHDIEKNAAEIGISIEQALRFQLKSWDTEAEREQEEAATNETVRTERAKAVAELPNALATLRSNGTPINPRQMLARLGLPPNKSNMGCIAYQLRQLAYQPGASVQPAE